jgi:hypothetical protein
VVADADDALAAATPYLELLATMVAAAFLGRQVLNERSL